LLPRKGPVRVRGGRCRSAPARKAQSWDDFQRDWTPPPRVIYKIQKAQRIKRPDDGKFDTSISKLLYYTTVRQARDNREAAFLILR